MNATALTSHEIVTCVRRLRLDNPGIDYETMSGVLGISADAIRDNVRRERQLVASQRQLQQEWEQLNPMQEMVCQYAVRHPDATGAEIANRTRYPDITEGYAHNTISKFRYLIENIEQTWVENRTERIIKSQ